MRSAYVYARVCLSDCVYSFCASTMTGFLFYRVCRVSGCHYHGCAFLLTVTRLLVVVRFCDATFVT